MNRVAALALVAACSAPASQRSAPVAPAPAPPAQPTPAPPVVHSDPADGAIEAPPAGALRMLAVTPDGDAALAADQLHGLRLWPALDGSREPRIVELPEPRALALGRRGDGFVAAVIDAAGGLYIATLDAEGRAHSHVSLAADPPWVGIAMAAHGLVAWRADQSVALLDGDGATVARLPTEAGERIIALAVAGERAAVLLDRGGQRGVRTIALDRPAWGAWIDLASGTADLVALAPSGRIAVRDGKAITQLDPGGKVVARAADAAADSLAFVDDDDLAITRGNRLVWVGAAKQPETATLPVVAGGRHAISAAVSDVVIATPTETKYLGYDVESPAVTEATADGQMAIGSVRWVYTLDAQLRVASTQTITVGGIFGLRWLGDDAWAFEAGIDAVDLRLAAGGTVNEVARKLDQPYLLAYEPSTRLLTLSLGSSPAVYRYDPGKHELARVAQDHADPYVQIELVPVVPARAGAELVRIAMGSKTTVQWLPDATKLDRASATATFLGSVAAVDATGNVYAWVSEASGLALVVFRDGKRVRSQAASSPVSVWPDPQGRRIAEIATHAVSLVTSDGQRAWSIPVERASTAVWLSDGALAVVTTAGIERLDPATGKVMAARCGWGFGLSARPHPGSPAIEPVCAQLEGGDQ